MKEIEDIKKEESDTVKVRTSNFLKTYMTVKIKGTIHSEFVEVKRIGGDDTNPIYGYRSDYFKKYITI